jgi:hypothetical protein
VAIPESHSDALHFTTPVGRLDRSGGDARSSVAAVWSAKPTLTARMLDLDQPPVSAFDETQLEIP